MHAETTSTSRISPAVAAFWARNAKSEGQISDINLRVIQKPEQRLKRKRPKLPSKNKGGAPSGNRNALSSGLNTKELRALRASARHAIAMLKLSAAAVCAEAAMKDADTFSRLRDAGLDRRSIWQSEL